MKDDNQEITKKSEPIILTEQEETALSAVAGNSWKKYSRIAMTALGSIPWVGSILSVVASISSEKEQDTKNKILALWIDEHEHKFKELGMTLNEIFTRFESFGDKINKRIDSPEYLTLVRKTFRQWDQAETMEKREMLKKILINSGVITLAQDDLIRLFLEWIEKYHEFHFTVIREIYKNSRITRSEIWRKIRGEQPIENSAEADLFKLLIRDLTTGSVIRQEKDVNALGQFMKKAPTKGNGSSTYESAFEDTKLYVLTELGAQFVHYVMSDVVQQLEGGKV
jgi:hypothetical protein